MHWGSQNDCREIRGGASSDIGYFKKAASYVTKDVFEERPKGESRNRKHLMMLDMAARAMCCDKCIEKARSCFGAGTPNFTGKRMAMEKVKFNARQESRLEFPLRVCLEDFEGAREFPVKARYYRLVFASCLKCDSLPHRRWGSSRWSCVCIKTNEKTYGLVCNRSN